MKKRNLVALAVVLVLLCNFLGVQSTGAWFVSGGAFGDNRYETAQVMYLPALQTEARYESEVPKYGQLIKGTPSGNTEISKVVFLIPGENLIDGGERQVGDTTIAYPELLSLENFSTVPTNVRVQMEMHLNPQKMDGSGDDPVIAGAQFEWRQKTGTDLYYYGMKDENQVFMPLLQVEFANITAANTVLPNDPQYQAAINDVGTYLWQFKQPATNDELPLWDLLRGGNASIPALASGKTQFYNVLSNVSLATSPMEDNLSPEEAEKAQDAFNAFFSDHYAGHELNIQVLYYAKQEAGMAWSLFSDDEISMIAQSRDKTRS